VKKLLLVLLIILTFVVLIAFGSMAGRYKSDHDKPDVVTPKKPLPDSEAVDPIDWFRAQQVKNSEDTSSSAPTANPLQSAEPISQAPVTGADNRNLTSTSRFKHTPTEHTLRLEVDKSVLGGVKVEAEKP